MPALQRISQVSSAHYWSHGNPTTPRQSICYAESLDTKMRWRYPNQFSNFSPHLCWQEQAPLSSNSQWWWEEPQQELKAKISRSPTLALFDPSQETTVSTDASSYGLGAALFQESASEEMMPVDFISLTMTLTEQQYVQIEKEALAITWACDNFVDYLMWKQNINL